MSEAKENSNSSNPATGLIHPVGTTVNKSERKANGVLCPSSSFFVKKPSTPTIHRLDTSTQPSQSAPVRLFQPVSSSNNSQPKSDDIQFNSTIGSKNSQKFDPFAEQNIQRSAKRQQQARKRKNLIIFSSIIGGLVIIGIVTFIVIKSKLKEPINEENEAAEIISNFNTIQNESQLAFDGTNKSATEIISYYEDLIKKTTSNEEKITLHISEISSLNQNGFIGEAIEASSKFEQSPYRQDSNQAQLSIYYGTMINIYSSFNNAEQINYYTNLLQQTDFKSDAEVIG